MPGEQGEKAVRIKDLGTVIAADDLAREMLNNRSVARPLFEMKRPNGQKWTVHFIDGLGLGVVSHQTNRVFVLEVQPIIQLACEAGVEDAPALIIPATEVPCG
jgi:hypothetical protein